MCVKGQVFKQFFAVILSGPTMVAPHALQVFKYKPSDCQVYHIIKEHLIRKNSIPQFYTEDTRVSVMPINIPMDILYH